MAVDAAVRGALFGAFLLSMEELTNLGLGQAALRVVDVAALGACYTAAMAVLGVLLWRCRSPTAHLLAMLALSFGFMAGGKVAEELWWWKMSQLGADAVGFPVGFASAGLGLWMVTRLTRDRPAVLSGICWGSLVFVPAFRAMNINAYGTPIGANVLVADGVLALACVAMGIVLYRWAPRLHTHVNRSLAIAVLVVSVGTGLGRWATQPSLPTPAPSSNRTDVLLVVIDTLRADHLGVYGYDRPTSANIDALAAKGLRYTAAGSPASWTLPSFGSFVTGLYPAGHGAGANDGERSAQSGIHADLPTLAERMQQAGYRTGAIVTNPYLKRAFGIDRGFSTYSDALGLAHIPMFLQPLRMLRVQIMSGRYFYRPANLMVDEALEWWTATEGGPRFLMLHLMDPHDPYNPPSMDVAALGAVHTDPDEDAYDAEIRFTDRELGRLLAAVGDEVVVIVTSDHGETFGEHPDPYPQDHWPFTRHGHTLYQELLHVPLMVVGPGIPVDIIDRPVRAFDVVPTILDIATAEPFPVAGQPLWEAIGRTAPAAPSAVGAQAMRFGTEKRAVRLGDDKLIRSRWGDELYDLAADPAELDNRAERQPATVTHLATLLPTEGTAQVAAEIDLETKRQLEALGYVQ
jgi:arylsulfatase A-like enzyme